MTTAEELIANAKALLLDFDGPVTALMPAPANAEAAEKARAPLQGLTLPNEVIETTDHLAVLRWTFQNAPSRMGDVERACTSAEIACALTSQPSPEIDWLLEQAAQRLLRLAIVSYNSEKAVRAFLDRFAWSERFTAYACRTPETSRLLKPHPFLVIAATQLLDVAPQDCVFIGDSISDIRAGRSAGVVVVGLAKSADRRNDLRDAKPDALILRA
jgi:phosphoglycolate phosphatase